MMFWGIALFVLGLISQLFCSIEFEEPVVWFFVLSNLMVLVGLFLICEGEEKIIEKIKNLEKALKEREAE